VIERTRRATARRIVGLLFVAFAAVGSGCAKKTTSDATHDPLLVFGIDGADWDRAVPLMRQGKMPTLSTLVRTGTVRTLESIGEEWLSPAIWTTVATGVLPPRHGILHFVTETASGYQPITSNQRKVGALWNIVSARERTVGVIGWLATWPAESVNGYLVSSYAPHTFAWAPERPIKGTIVQGVPNQVWPVDLQQELETHKVLPGDVGDDELRDRFTGHPVPSDPSEDARASIEGMRWSWAADDTYREIFHVLAGPEGRPRPDLEMLYFGSVDVVSHRFWKYMDPASYPLGPVPADEIASLGPSVENAYRSMDGVLADVLSEDRDSQRILVLSDHGFRPNDGPSAARSSGWHRTKGVLLACGPGFEKGTVLPPGSVVDVAPTVLYSLGLPVAEDMDGRPALDLFTAEFQRRHEVVEIPSYEPEVAPARATAPVQSPVDAEIIERLTTLGYLGG
jgi:predicted AlkP superfamily phosphohydrolase/phosphomutase